MKTPKPLKQNPENFDTIYYELQKSCIAFMTFLEGTKNNNYAVQRTYGTNILETAMESVYGKTIWDYVSKEETQKLYAEYIKQFYS